MKSARWLLALLVTLLFALPGRALVPHTLQYAVPAPPVGVQTGANLGSSVAIDGPYVICSAPNDNTVDQGAGVLKIFDSTTGALRFVLKNPDRSLGVGFGSESVISGNIVVVAAPVLDASLGASIAAWVYDLASATPSVPVFTLENPNLAVDYEIIHSLAISGTRVVLGVGSYPGSPSNVGRVYVYDLASPTPTAAVFTLQNPHPVPDGEFGRSVAISGTRVLIGARKDEASPDYAGCVYFYDLASATPTVPVATLTKPNPAMYDYFGMGSLAISGTLAAVGCWGDDALATDAGNVYFYDLASATPGVPVLTLNKPNPSASAIFGFRVSLSGSRFLSSSDFNSASAAIHVFDLSSATPTTAIAVLPDPNPAPQDYYGQSVAIDGTRVAVAAPSDDTGATDAGSVYLFELTGATPATPLAKLNDPGTGPLDQFGYAVAVSGTLLAVSAPGGNRAEPMSYVQSVYVYDLAGATPLVAIAALRNPHPTANDMFGLSVAIEGTRVVVGAPLENTGGNDAGSAYIYDLTSADPGTPVLTLHNPSPADLYWFGNAVALSGTRVVVAAPVDKSSAPHGGKVYVYDLAGGAPAVPVVILNSPAQAHNDYFGYSIAIEGARLVAGAHNESGGGSAYVYDLASAVPATPVWTLHDPNPTGSGAFGQPVALSGSRVAVGANVTTYNVSGTVHVFDLAGATPTVPVATLQNPTLKAADYFGTSLAIQGTQVAVGSPFDSTIAYNSGTVYMYDLAGATPTLPVATVRKSLPYSSDHFGSAVAISGDTLAVGTPGDSTQMFQKGGVYTYTTAPNPKDMDEDGLLDSWELAHFGTATGHSATGDDEQDGLINLLEEAFGTDPLHSDQSAAPAVVVEGGFLTITISKQPGVRYEVQSAPNPDPPAFSATTTTVMINTATTLKVRDNHLITKNPSRFLRVKVTAAP